MSGRLVNAALGLWLFVSAFLWTHSPAQFTNAWLCGVLIAAFAVAGARVSQLRYANVVMGGWLILSTLILPRFHGGTFWNHLTVGLIVLMLALFPTRGDRRVRGQPTTTLGSAPGWL